MNPWEAFIIIEHNIVGRAKQGFHSIQSIVGALPMLHSTHTPTIARFGFRSFFNFACSQYINAYMPYHHHQHHSSLCFFSTIGWEKERERAHTRSLYDALAKRAQWGRNTCYQALPQCICSTKAGHLDSRFPAFYINSWIKWSKQIKTEK